MFGIDSSELLLVAFVALVVIGPKDLPKAMRVVGYWVGRARGVARQFRSGFDNMVREAELEEMEKRWASENERIMLEHPQPAAVAGDDEAVAPVEMEPAMVPAPHLVDHDEPVLPPAVAIANPVLTKPDDRPAGEGAPAV